MNSHLFDNINAFWSRALVVGVSLVTVLTGCDGCDKGGERGGWETKRVAAQAGEQNASIVIYSPPYGNNAKSPDEVEILWNGSRVFKGKLPSQSNGVTGMPVKLLVISVGPDTHVLEVVHEAASHKESIQLSANETISFQLFGLDEDGQEQLLNNLGSDPRFE